MKQLQARHGDQVQFVEVFIKQAHPGERNGAYHSYEEKRAQASEYKREEGIPWPVVVDDLAGTVHQTYGGMDDPTYLIDAAGRVAFYQMWTSVPALSQALEELLARPGHLGTVRGGIDRVPHLMVSFVDGWRAIMRGGLRAALDYEIGVPGSSTLTFLGNLAKPLLRPLVLRATPLPMPARLALGGGLSTAVAGTVWLLRRQT